VGPGGRAAAALGTFQPDDLLGIVVLLANEHRVGTTAPDVSGRRILQKVDGNTLLAWTGSKGSQDKTDLPILRVAIAVPLALGAWYG
jgi:hypothetical protein